MKQRKRAKDEDDAGDDILESPVKQARVEDANRRIVIAPSLNTVNIAEHLSLSKTASGQTQVVVEGEFRLTGLWLEVAAAARSTTRGHPPFRLLFRMPTE